ncbi:hypothetical protein PsorP6_008340 [Peronosclerospora sorghi]|uniref:Uncharacterized protein n=1 Tax=Peronosclerospora sorghi TaxID=230839 RepID=A0ACC0W923_9STRA|nr:hypothetical protein PsorP6_008340 [Peronosclerospora sorghi]
MTISLFFAGSGGSSSRQLVNGIANGMSKRAERRRHKTKVTRFSASMNFSVRANTSSTSFIESSIIRQSNNYNGR